APDATLTQYFVKGLLIRTVISDGRGRVLELVSGQDADNAFTGCNHALLLEPAGPSHAGSGRGFTTEAAGPDLGFRIEDLLIRHFAHQAAAIVQSAQRFGQVHGPIDFDGACNGGRTDLRGIRLVDVFGR